MTSIVKAPMYLSINEKDNDDDNFAANKQIVRQGQNEFETLLLLFGFKCFPSSCLLSQVFHQILCAFVYLFGHLGRRNKNDTFEFESETI